MTCVQGNAENLPFEDNTFDAYTIAFGIRNVVHIDQVSYDFLQFLDMHSRCIFILNSLYYKKFYLIGSF